MRESERERERKKGREGREGGERGREENARFIPGGVLPLGSVSLVNDFLDLIIGLTIFPR